MDTPIIYFRLSLSDWFDFLDAQITVELNGWNLLEIAAVLLSLAYVVLLMREKVWCWPVGILSSCLSIGLFVNSGLFSEAILYLYYVGMGVYGWTVWARPSGEKLPIAQLSLREHLYAVMTGAAGGLGLGFTFQQLAAHTALFSNASMTYPDGFSTAFAFVATYLQVRKALYSWAYWIVLNAFSVYLYGAKGLYVYAALMVVYTLISISGQWNWLEKMKAEED